jgi:hypothetical protein
VLWTLTEERVVEAGCEELVASDLLTMSGSIWGAAHYRRVQSALVGAPPHRGGWYCVDDCPENMAQSIRNLGAVVGYSPLPTVDLLAPCAHSIWGAPIGCRRPFHRCIRQWKHVVALYPDYLCVRDAHGAMALELSRCISRRPARSRRIPGTSLPLARGTRRCWRR